MEWQGGWKVGSDNFALEITGDGLGFDAFDRVTAGFGPAFWADEESRRKLRSMTPEYRLSKFQKVLPDRWQTEMVGAYLLDFDGVRDALHSMAPS